MRNQFTGRRLLRTAAIAAVAALSITAFSACSGGSDDGGDGGDTEVPKLLYAVMGDPGADAVPGIYAAVKLGEEYGYDVEITEVAEPTLMMEGISSGEFQFGGNGPAFMFPPLLNGANAKMIGAETGMTWIMQGVPGLKTCADLAGKRVGLHAVGSSGEGYFNYWASQNCTEEEREALNILYVPGSEARAQALLAGELDATMITYTDLPLVEGTTETMFEFKDVGDLANVIGSGIAVNNDFAEKYPEVVQQYADELVKGQAEMTTMEGMIEAIKVALPNTPEEDVEQAAQLAFDNDTMLQDGGIDKMKNLNDVLDFMTEVTGELPEGSQGRADEISDLSYLEKAVENNK